MPEVAQCTRTRSAFAKARLRGWTNESLIDPTCRDKQRETGSKIHRKPKDKITSDFTTMDPGKAQTNRAGSSHPSADAGRLLANEDIFGACDVTSLVRKRRVNKRARDLPFIFFVLPLHS